MEKFTQIRLSRGNVDVYYHRKALFEAISTYLHSFQGHFLDVGCGKMPYRSYILENSHVKKYVGLDIETALVYDHDIKPDLRWDGVTMPIGNNSYDTVMATEVLEHCPEPLVTLHEIFRVMKPGGRFFFTVPFIWNLHEQPFDFYRYTPNALQMLLEKTGFKDIEIHGLGGWHASLAQMLGLWLKRSPMKRNYQYKIMYRFLWVVYKRLIKMAQSEPIDLKSEQMFTGLYGIAVK